MRRCLTTALIVAATLSQSLTAFARTDCPPGAWFCAGEEADPGAPPAEAAPAPPDADALPPPPPPAVVDEPIDDAVDVPEPAAQPAPRGHHRANRPPVVIYQPAPSASPPPQIIIIAPGGNARVVRRPAPAVRVIRAPAPAPVRFVAPTPKRRWQPEWGLNLRLEGVSLGDHRDGAAADASMGGFGVSLRYRPVPSFAFDVGLDVLGGTDWNGFDRTETPFSVNGLLYLNPRSRAQFYFLGGVNWSHATVSSESPDPRLSPNATGSGFSTEYGYFGAQGGIGLELRLSRRFALNVDALGFVRKRTDDNVKTSIPEFTDRTTGQTTNVSGGGLFRGGMTFWW